MAFIAMWAKLRKHSVSPFAAVPIVSFRFGKLGGAGVRTAFVAPILVPIRHGLTCGTTVGTVVYGAHGGAAAQKKSVYF